jgi:DNA polymerase-4
MDAYYASVEQLDNPVLQNKPIAVGSDGKRGVIATASYEARKFGVRSAMPSYKAKKLCPSLIFVKPRFARYKEISLNIRSVFREFTDLIEPLSLDEAFLDVTNNKLNIESAIKVALLIKDRIEKQTGLTASAGVSINKFLAKIASDINKPNGIKWILPDEVDDFLENLPIEKFFGVGKATVRKMHHLDIYSGKDLKALTLEQMIKHFGKNGKFFFDVVRGNDFRPVEPNRVRKSISSEETYIDDLENIEHILNELYKLSSDVYKTMNKRNIKGRTVTLKVRYDDFQTITRSKSVIRYFNEIEQIYSLAKFLFESLDPLEKGIRLLGVGMSNLDTEIATKQLDFDF